MYSHEKFLAQYLKSKKLSIEAFDFEACVAEIKTSMEKSLYTNDGGLPMLPAFVKPSSLIKFDEPVLVIDAGGTNVRVAKLSFNQEGEADFSYLKTFPMPGSLGKSSKLEFLDCLIDHMLPALGDIKRLGFCFSYPVEIQVDGDGKVLFFGKEIAIDDMNGSLLIASLKERMQARNLKVPEIAVVVNDTVATLLGGASLAFLKKFELGIGFILGTGINMAYIEKTANIAKLSPEARTKYLDEDMVINTELGCFMPSFRGDIDIELDEASHLVLDHGFEKMISGRYLGELLSLTLRDLARNNKLAELGFKTDTIDYILQLGKENKHFNTIDLSNFLDNPWGENKIAKLLKTSEEKLRALIIARALVTRAAFLLTVCLCAVANKTGQGLDPLHPLVVAMDGSTYYKTTYLQETAQTFLNQYLIPKGIYVRFTQTEHGNLLGAGIAALSA